MSFFKKGELRLLWPFYLESFVGSLFFFYPIFCIVYFTSIGFSLTQIGFLFSAYGLAALLFEIPTGVIADIYGRKFSTILGYFLTGVLMIGVVFFSNFYIVLFLFFLRGAVGTFSSGADEAWMVDLLKYKKRKDLIIELYNKRHSLISASMLICGILGSIFVKNFGLWIIWPVTGIATILSAVVLSFADEYFTRKKLTIGKRTRQFLSHTKQSIGYSLKHPVLLYLILGSLFICLVNNIGSVTWIPYLTGIGVKDYWLGYIVSASFILGIFAPFVGKKIKEKTGNYKIFIASFVAVQLLLLLAIFFANWWLLGVVIYCLFLSLFDFYGPALNVFFQHYTPSKLRATIGSFQNSVLQTMQLIIPPLAGFTADKIGPQNTLVISAFFLIPTIIFYLKIKE